jgi:hypothetical protein
MEWQNMQFSYYTGSTPSVSEGVYMSVRPSVTAYGLGYPHGVLNLSNLLKLNYNFLVI